MWEVSFLVESQCFLTNCQLMQEMSAPESTSAEESTTFNMCKGMMNCMGILIDLFKVDTSIGAHITKEGELCVEVSLPFKNPYLIQERLELLFVFFIIFNFFELWELLFFTVVLDVGFLG